ncbi:hypothetical protein DH2020_038666 [Rehmannia glutinosa]|uniref:Uncharacterized protein n=1 Tax=Rehmannia glutinosa TaxID=99300 RepID=A0ABR0V041_REHGL
MSIPALPLADWLICSPLSWLCVFSVFVLEGVVTVGWSGGGTVPENGGRWKMLSRHWSSGEVREGAERVGFEVVTLDGRRGPLASTNISSRESQRWPIVGRYKVDISSFESLALPELQVKEDTDLFIIDEVGKMELFSSSFFPAVLRVLESNIPLLATVPIPKTGRDIPGVARLKNHPGATIYTLNTSNRDAMKEQIYSNLVDSLQIH